MIILLEVKGKLKGSYRFFASKALRDDAWKLKGRML
jgi:hypothetical protein